MARMSKADRAIEDRVNAAFSKHANCVQFNIMDLGKVTDAGRDALRAGNDLDAAMIAAVAQYRQN